MKNIFFAGFMIALIMVFVTAVLIYNQNYKNTHVIEEPIEVIEPVEEEITLYKYYNLPIKDETKGVGVDYKYSSNSIKWEKEFYEDAKIAGYYYQISGLIDKDSENTVNQKLKDSALEYGQKAYTLISNGIKEEKFKDGSVYTSKDAEYETLTAWKAYFDQCILASFSNVISVASGSFLNYKDENYSNSRQYDIYKNLDLRTGNDIEFASLFASNIDTYTLARKMFYKALPIEDSYTYDVEYWRESNRDNESSGDEDDRLAHSSNQMYMEVDVSKVYKMMLRFEHSEKLNFFFTASQFGISIDNNLFVKQFSDLLGNVAIYNRFLSDESIFENNDLTIKNLEAYQDYMVDNTLKQNVYRKNDDGVLYSYVVYSKLNEGNPEDAKIINSALKKIEEKVKEEAELLKNLKQDQADAIYFTTGFTIVEPSFKNYKELHEIVSDDLINKVEEQIDSSKRFYCIEKYGDTRYFRFSMKESNSGLIEEMEKYYMLDKIGIEGNYDKYFEIASKASISEDYYDSLSFRSYSEFLNQTYNNVYYKAEDSKTFDNNIDYLKYMLKDSSEEGLNQFLQTAYEYVIEREENRSEKVAGKIKPNDYTIADYKINYHYYDSSLDRGSSVSFRFLDRDIYGGSIFKPYSINYENPT